MSIFEYVNDAEEWGEWKMNGKEKTESKKWLQNGGVKIEEELPLNYEHCEKRVLVIYTGGTIGMVDDPDGCK